MKKTSENWQKECLLLVLDPDGWDRSNFDYSWYKEEITKEEFENRLIHSTVKGNLGESIWKKELRKEKLNQIKIKNNYEINKRAKTNIKN